MAQYVCWSSAGAYVESDGRARSPVRLEGLVGRLEPANDKPPTYWLSAHGRPSPSSGIRAGSRGRFCSASEPILTRRGSWRKALWANRVGAPVSLCRPRWGWSLGGAGSSHLAGSALRRPLMKAEGKLWLEVFVCNHVTFPAGHGQRRQRIASDFSSRCFEMVLMLWIMSVGERAERNSRMKAELTWEKCALNGNVCRKCIL